MNQYVNNMHHRDPENFPFVVIGNKIDMSDSRTVSLFFYSFFLLAQEVNKINR